MYRRIYKSYGLETNVTIHTLTNNLKDKTMNVYFFYNYLSFNTYRHMKFMIVNDN